MKAKANLRIFNEDVAHSHKTQPNDMHSTSQYRHLLWMSLLHLPLMYFIMFSMVYSLGEVFHNLNNLYMAGMMVAPMMALMPLLMRKMYAKRKLNWIVYVSSAALLVALYLFTRNQNFIDDKQFVRSMIPHHSGAVLMCERAKLQDRELLDLCQTIVQGQTAEIEQMKTILQRLRSQS